MVTALARSAAPDVIQETELGPLPEDWRVAPLSELCAFENGDRGFNYPSKRDFQRIGVPFVNAGHLREGRIDFGDMDYISQAKFNSLGGGRFVPGDVLFCLRGSLGKFAVVEEATPIGTVASSLVIVRPDVKKITLGFLKAYCGSEFASRMITLWAGGAAQPNLGAKDLARFVVALPPTVDEQQAIAEALSDADALISSLETLIAKKRAIKQGAMQVLLSGRKRLPGFHGKWKEWSILNLAEGKKPLFDDGDWIEAEHLAAEGVRFVQTGNIGVGEFLDRAERKYVRETSVQSLRCKFIEPGDLLICRLADPAGRACIMPDIDEQKMVTSVDVTIFRPPSHLANREFLQQVFSTDEWLQLVSERSGGTTHKRIARGALGKLVVTIPSVEEQGAIAAVLSEMDAEIRALSERLSKLRQIKQGMMQELLTGRVRLI